MHALVACLISNIVVLLQDNYLLHEYLKTVGVIIEAQEVPVTFSKKSIHKLHSRPIFFFFYTF